MFFFLNGMTLKLDNVSFGDFLAKKVKAFMIPAVGLAIVAVILDGAIRTALQTPLDSAFFWRGFYFCVNQTRFTALWFLTALFFCDVFLFGLHRLFKGNIWLVGLGSMALLALGICYNIFYKVPIAWNIDASFIGTAFTYFGFLLTSKNLSFLYQSLVKTRWVSLLVGTVILVLTYFLSMHIWLDYKTHLNMFGSVYGVFYLTLPCALLGSLGFIFACRGITNPVCSYPVKFNLMLLMVHQGFCFPLFKGFIVRPWWNRAAYLSVDSFEFNMFVLSMTIFSLLFAIVFYGLIIVTPLSFIVNKPRYPISKLIEQIKTRHARCSDQ